jgi:hypothetical protein
MTVKARTVAAKEEDGASYLHPKKDRRSGQSCSPPCRLRKQKQSGLTPEHSPLLSVRQDPPRRSVALDLKQLLDVLRPHVSSILLLLEGSRFERSRVVGKGGVLDQVLRQAEGSRASG